MAEVPGIPHGKGKGGPPIWLYGGLLGLLAVAYMYMHHTSSAVAPAAVNSGAGYPVLTSDPLGSSGGGAAPASPGGGGSPTTSNGDWEAEGVVWLTTHAICSPIAGQTAIELYLAGNPLTYTQGQYINKLIAGIGMPPQGVQGTPIVGAKPTPAAPRSARPAPTKPAPIHHPPTLPVVHKNPPIPNRQYIYTVQMSDTIRTVAQKMYGHSNLYDWQAIAYANHMWTTGPRAFKIAHGERLVIPPRG